jgi:hypothetical protein
VEQSQPDAKPPKRSVEGARFCARLLVFKGLGSFFCNFKMTPKYTLEMFFRLFYSGVRSGCVARAASAVPNDPPMTAVARSLGPDEAIHTASRAQRVGHGKAWPSMLLLGGAALQFDPRAQPLHRDDLILDCEIDQRTPTLIDRRQDRPHPPVERVVAIAWGRSSSSCRE